MATIALYKNKTNQMPSLIKDLKRSVTNYKSEIGILKNKVLTINKSVCNLDDVISSMQSSSQVQEDKIASLEAFNQNSEEFISDTVLIDCNVADLVGQRKDNFYEKYNYLKPECEKDGWEKFCDGCKKVGEWCKEHWKQIVNAVLVIVAVTIIVLCPGLLLTIAKKFLVGAAIGSIFEGVMSAINGDSFWDGFKNGFLIGGILGMIGGGVSLIYELTKEQLWVGGSLVLLKFECPIALQMYQHGMYGNGRTVTSTALNDKIKNDPYFQSELSSKLNEVSGDTVTDLEINLNYSNDTDRDLYLAIGRISLYVSGRKSADGKWILTVKGSDVYDFDKFRLQHGLSMGNFANDLGFLMQKIAMMKKFTINVDFSITV